MATDPVTTADSLDARMKRLYAQPLADFTAARNDLSKVLRGAGDSEAAHEVKALRKPTITAWAVNQVVHHYGDEWSTLLEATDGIRKAHATGPSALSTAIAERNAALAAVVETTKGILVRAGSPAAAPQTRRITGSLEALASGTASVRPGRLVVDLEPPGFGGLAGLELAVVRRPRAPAHTPIRSPKRSRKGPGPAKAAVVGQGETSVVGQGEAARLEAREAEATAESARTAAAIARANRALEEAERTLSSATAAAEDARVSREQGARQAVESATATDAARAAAEAARSRLLEAQSAQAGLERRLKKLAREEEAADRDQQEAHRVLADARTALDRL